jgi:hypothetical protein
LSRVVLYAHSWYLRLNEVSRHALFYLKFLQKTRTRLLDNGQTSHFKTETQTGGFRKGKTEKTVIQNEGESHNTETAKLSENPEGKPPQRKEAHRRYRVTLGKPRKRVWPYLHAETIARNAQLDERHEFENREKRGWHHYRKKALIYRIKFKIAKRKKNKNAHKSNNLYMPPLPIHIHAENWHLKSRTRIRAGSLAG